MVPATVLAAKGPRQGIDAKSPYSSRVTPAPGFPLLVSLAIVVAYNRILARLAGGQGMA